MQKIGKIGFVLVIASSSCWGMAQDSLHFKGQVSAWALYNPDNALPVYAGGRYIPQLNYYVQLPGEKLIDFEASANINGTGGLSSLRYRSCRWKDKTLPVMGQVFYQPV